MIRPFLVLPAVFVATLPTPGLAVQHRFLASVDLGFDSFTERYSVVEEDTVENVAEFRSRLDLNFRLGAIDGSYLLLGGWSALGSSSREISGRFDLGRRSRHLRFRLEANLTAKMFRESSSYSYANDYLRGNVRALLSRSLGGDFSLRATYHLEGVDFKERTEFDYDYLRNTLRLTVDRSTLGLFYGRVSLQAVTKSIPDSTAIAYKAYGGTLELRKDVDRIRGVELWAAWERRVYAHKPTRSPFWSAMARLSAKPFRWGNAGLIWENAVESYAYDWDSDVYFSYWEGKTALLGAYHPGIHLQLSLGPTYGFLNSDYSPRDDYKELGGRCEAEYTKIPFLWLSLAGELGKRVYQAYSSDPSQSLFSDYVYYRLSLFLTVKISGDLSLSVFIDHQPQKHKRPGDDTATTMFSVDLSYSF